MTEKRFFILQLEDDDLPCIRDRTFQLDDIYGHYKYDNLEQLCSFLNEQHEDILFKIKLIDSLQDAISELKAENEKLKEENKSWLKTASRMDTIHHEDRRYCDRLHRENEQLKQENQELRQDNDIKFWKHQFMTQYNRIQLILHELSLAMNEGYEVSDKFKEWLDDLREKNKEIITKHERLFECLKNDYLMKKWNVY